MPPSFSTYLERLNSVLGMLEAKDEAAPGRAEIEEKIARREKARKEKDFARADDIRAELKKQGIVLHGHPRRREVEAGIAAATTKARATSRRRCARI